MLTTSQLSKLLHMSYRSTYRLAKKLNFPAHKQNNKLLYTFEWNHPLTLSLNLINNKTTKPLYSIKDIATLWLWSRGNYCHERVRQKLDEYDVPIHNKRNKGYVYLYDLKKLLRENDDYQ